MFGAVGFGQAVTTVGTSKVSFMVDFNQIVNTLGQAGIEKGDSLIVHSRLFTIGLVHGVTSVSEIPGLYLEAFQTAVGDRGTIVVPTYTTSFGRFGKPFVFEKSPSEMGAFSEYVRKSKGSRRTLHPIQSLAAIGAKAEVLTKDHPRWNVGYDTIWDRLLKHRGKVVTLGIPPRQCMSLVHHLEFLACVPYLYHKILRGEVYAGGVRIQEDFLIAVRYLNFGISWDLSRLESDLSAMSAIRRVALGEDWVWVVSMDDVFEACMRGLRNDSYYLLQKAPCFIEGQIPCDGTTSRREESIPNYFEILR